MQMIKASPFGEDKTISMSLTGVTILKQGKYSMRHGGSSEINENFRSGLVLKKNDGFDYSKPEKKTKVPENPESNNAKIITHTPTPKAYKINRKQITHRIRNYVNQMPGKKKLYFWTATFPQGTNDDECYILLNRWLTRLRKEFQLKSYLWVCERQDGKRINDTTQLATNTLHFHIALHQWIDIKKANKYMRACIMTSIKSGAIKWSHESAMKYNGIDIAKDRTTKKVINFAAHNKSKSLTNYLTKYVSKSNETFTHLAWHCSRDYSNLIIQINITDSEYIKNNLQSLLLNEAIFDTEFITFFKWVGSPPTELVKYLSFVNRQVVSLIWQDQGFNVNN